jgi:hypothetical protein
VAPANTLSGTEATMSGSPGNTSEGTKGGRTPRGTNDDLIQRHGAGGPDSTARTDATTDARERRGPGEATEPGGGAPESDGE